jgi:hypothetical protein
MDNVSFIISSIPNVIWSALIASLLTFLGVMWIKRGDAHRQQKSPTDEESKFQIEQNMAFKKEAYFEMAAMFARTLSTFKKLTELEYSPKELREHARDPEEAVAKAILIADADTVSKLQEFSFALNEALIHLLRRRETLLDNQRSIDTYKEIITNANAEKDRLITILKESNMQGQGDIYTLTSIEDSYKSQEEIIANAQNKIDEIKAAFKQLHREFINNCWTEYSRFSVAMAPVTIAVRNELGSDIDAGKFEQIIQTSMSRVLATIEKTVLVEEEK